jgi:hypothetical protein
MGGGTREKDDKPVFCPARLGYPACLEAIGPRVAHRGQLRSVPARG